ncbi:MAG: phage shock protein A [Flavobacteriales bacterium]|jgi:phage shock protein A
MGIFSRISDIINANINSILDSAENPEKMIRLVIQEMEETLVEVRTNSAKIIAEKKEILRRSDKYAKQEHDWQQKAELAISKGREDLAKAALVEKSSVREAALICNEDLTKLEETLDRLSDEIEKLQSKLNDAKARQKSLLMRTKATQSRVNVNKKLHDGSINEAINKLDYFEQKIEQMEGQIEADNIGRNSLQSEFAELEIEDKIDAELAELKAKMAGNKQATEGANNENQA